MRIAVVTGASSGLGKEYIRQIADKMPKLDEIWAIAICLPYMKAKSRILEICSTAAFQPFQYLNVYAASKAFLYRYSRALAVELRSRKITVTAVCPYWIKDTEFIPIARQNSDDKMIRRI
ncbi:MAG: SDR family NAD(P)-dependent oxidoreductase [Lachnospiraceae bacterium]|nr:SDR family NAD(P)-dependent oxidoreductase [Lachnospiraceae bacterium]